TWRVNVSAGLIAAGRYHEALYTLPDHRLFRNSRWGKLQQAVCHNNGFAALIELKMTDAARQSLTLMYGAVEGLKPGKAQDRLSRLCRLNDAEYAMALGRFDGAEAVFREAVDKAESNYERVSAMLDLGLVHAHFGRTDEAREAFEYVIAHGNMLYAVAQARKALAALRP
ncbi:MAG: tetratricopeptide repeat protein, partial [Bacillota bacterium]